jgi:hypothetical protein
LETVHRDQVKLEEDYHFPATRRDAEKSIESPPFRQKATIGPEAERQLLYL